MVAPSQETIDKSAAERGVAPERFRIRFIVRALSCLALLFALNSCSIFKPRRTQKFIQYPVEPGDTLSGIGQRFNVSVRELKSMNGISDPKQLVIGQVVDVPYSGQSLEKGKVSSRSAGRSSGSAPPKGFAGQRSRGWDPNTTKSLGLGAAEVLVGRLAWPTGRRGYISSRFGRRWFSFHEGIDVAGPIGTPIYAAHDGVVAYSGSGLRGYGNLVVVKGDRLLSVYAHNKRNRVSRGERVRKGKHIADLGQSGKATGPHLHFEIRLRDKTGKNVAVDPLSFFPGKG